jgi:hypothetical protein
MAKRIKGMYTFLEVVKGNLSADSDPKLSSSVINEILEVLMSKRQFLLYIKVVHYTRRGLRKDEADSFLAIARKHNYKPALAKRVRELFPKDDEWLLYFIENSISNYKSVDELEEALWLASRPSAPENIQRIALNHLISRGRISEAKVFKLKLGEDFTKEEVSSMYRHIIKNDMVYELKELFDLPGVSVGMLKTFVRKYSVDWSEIDD